MIRGKYLIIAGGKWPPYSIMLATSGVGSLEGFMESAEELSFLRIWNTELLFKK